MQNANVQTFDDEESSELQRNVRCCMVYGLNRVKTCSHFLSGLKNKKSSLLRVI